MDPVGDFLRRSPTSEVVVIDFNCQIGDELQRLISVPPETGSSFTALLELPANQAMELLVNTSEQPPAAAAAAPIIFPSENSRAKLEIVKEEPMESVSDPNSNSSPAVSNPAVDQVTKSAKRKDMEKKVNHGRGSNKKSKKPVNESSDGSQLPYVHVRARRGQATDSHSLAERARRERINARMKLLQELVPGCDKISGTAMVLDEIINHVQSLQSQVEFLSMRLATANPRADFDFDTLLPTESGSPGEMSFPGMLMPSVWPDGQARMNREQYQQLWPVEELHQPVWVREEDTSNFIPPDNSLLSYSSSANSVQMHPNQLKMEL